MHGPNGKMARGRAGEDAAAAWYRARGFEVLDRNWRCPLGELDLIVGRPGLLVVCEVKARSSAELGGPFEAVTWRKQRKLRSLAEAYLLERGPQATDIRFDVASVSIGPSGASVFVFESAF